MRLPNSRPCMSVKAVTIVSIVPSLTALRKSSSDSMPALPPGPPGLGALMPELFRAAGRCRSGWRLAELVDRAHRARVPVLCRYQPPDRDDDSEQEHQRRVVERRRVEVAVPRHSSVRERELEGEHDDRDEEKRADVDPAVVPAEIPRAWPEVVALPQPQVHREDVRDVEADRADPGEREER